MSEIDQGVRAQLLASLKGGQAFDTFDDIVGAVPLSKRFVAGPSGRSAWQIVEHMRIALADLCGFIDNADGSYVEMSWPDDYWPKPAAPGQSESWDGSVSGVREELERIEGLLMDPSRDLLEPFPWGKGQTLLREVVLAVEHNAYHLGELVEF